MLFTSYEFIAFLCLTFLIYYLVPKKTQWVVLLLASYVFYLFAGIEYLAFIIGTTVISFVTALLLERFNKKTDAYLESRKDEMDKEARKAYKAGRKKS